jgi:hypothetical protein
MALSLPMRIIGRFDSRLSARRVRLAPQLVVERIRHKRAGWVAIERVLFEPHPIVGELAHKWVAPAPAQRSKR